MHSTSTRCELSCALSVLQGASGIRSDDGSALHDAIEALLGLVLEGHRAKVNRELRAPSSVGLGGQGEVQLRGKQRLILLADGVLVPVKERTSSPPSCTAGSASADGERHAVAGICTPLCA